VVVTLWIFQFRHITSLHASNLEAGGVARLAWIGKLRLSRVRHIGRVMRFRRSKKLECVLQERSQPLLQLNHIVSPVQIRHNHVVYTSRGATKQDAELN